MYCLNYAFVAGRRCGQRERLYRSLLAGLGGSAAADAQVVGGAVGDALKRDHDAVQETFERVDLIRVQVLVAVVEGDSHHNQEQELQQEREEASSARGLLGGDRAAAPPGEGLGVGAALGQDRALHPGLVQPVIARFQRPAGCPVDGTPARCAVQEIRRQDGVLGPTHKGPRLSTWRRNVENSQKNDQVLTNECHLHVTRLNIHVPEAPPTEARPSPSPA